MKEYKAYYTQPLVNLNLGSKICLEKAENVSSNFERSGFITLG